MLSHFLSYFNLHLILRRVIYVENCISPILEDRNGFLKLDATAYEALQIFQMDKHPSHIGIGRAKEGQVLN